MPSDAERRVADALDELRTGPSVNARSIGRLLMYRRDRPIAGLRIERMPQDRNGSWQWRVAVVQRAPGGADAGFTGFAGFSETQARESSGHSSVFTYADRLEIPPQTQQTPQSLPCGTCATTRTDAQCSGNGIVEVAA
jgi:hypothetical protein